MKSDLIWGWVFIAMALLMVFCIVVNCVNANWAGIPICVFALTLNTINSISRFKSYKRWKNFEDAFKTPRSSSGILSSGSFIDD